MLRKFSKNITMRNKYSVIPMTQVYYLVKISAMMLRVAFQHPLIYQLLLVKHISVTIDITDIMFLAYLEECQQHHCVSPVDRGHNGIQLRFEYASPDDANEHFGTISLTFYATTSRLLVQGTSYLLWIDEHLPIIYKKAEQTYENIGKWRSLARRRGIGVKRVTHQAREGRGHIIPSDPKGDRTGLPSSPHSPNTHPSASDKVSPSSAACPHAVCDSLSAASVSHESHSHPIPGGDRCSVPSLSPSLPILDTLHQDDPSPCGPSYDDLSRVNPSLGDLQEVSSQGVFQQDDPSREAVAQRDSPVTRSKRKLPESGELSGEKIVKKTESKRLKKKVKKDVKPKVTGKKLRCHLRLNTRLVSIAAPAVPSTIRPTVIWYDVHYVCGGFTLHDLVWIASM